MTSPIALTKEQIGSKILGVGFDRCGTTKIAKAHVFAKTSIFTGKTEFVIVTQDAKRKYMDVQRAAIYGKSGVDYHTAPTIVQLNKTLNKLIK